MRYFAGVDPDMKLFSCVTISEDLSEIDICVERCPDAITAPAARLEWWSCEVSYRKVDAVAIEVQNAQHMRRSSAKPQDILYLANMSGVAAGLVESDRYYFVQARDWKGQVSKGSNHYRTLKKLGWSGTKKGGKSPYWVPNPSSMKGVCWPDKTIKQRDWMDIMDSVGLALYCRERYLKEHK